MVRKKRRNEYTLKLIGEDEELLYFSIPEIKFVVLSDE